MVFYVGKYPMSRHLKVIPVSKFVHSGVRFKTYRSTKSFFFFLPNTSNRQ